MGLATIIVAAIALAAPSDAAVRADWAAHGQDPTLRYLSLDAVPNREKWEKIIQYQIPAASRAENIDRQVPQRVGQSNAYRIDLAHLHWDTSDFSKVLEKYPFAVNDPDYPQLVVRGDWLVWQLADTKNSNAYYTLLYGSKSIPKNTKEFLKFWGVGEDQTGARFGWVEGRSQVSLQEIRFVEHFIGRAGRSVWLTKDLAKIEQQSDPLEYLDGNFPHDAEEAIAQFVKSSARYQIRGSAQAYGLFNGKGEVQHVAPVNIVEDYNRTLGSPELTNNASCVTCHENGMKDPTDNNLKSVLKLGENLYSWSKETAEQIEDFHLSDSATTLQRNNQDFASFVTACNGLGPQENSKVYRLGLKDYRADLSLQRAALELYCEPNELKLALAYASANKIIMPARVVGLAHGQKIPRSSWEGAYLATVEILKVWKAGQK